MVKTRNFRDDDFKPVAQAIGEVVLAWNDLHQVLGILFWFTVGIKNALVPFAVWHSSKVDRAQREMQQALVDLEALGLDIRKDVRGEFRWLLKEINKLEDHRNNAVHSLLMKGDEGIAAGAHQFGHQRAKRLADKDPLREFQWLYDSIVTVRDHSAALINCVRDAQHPLPERLKMPSRGDSNQ